MATEKRLKRDIGLKPRKTGDLPPERLAQILGGIYPEGTVTEIMEKLFYVNGGTEDESCDD